MTVAVEPQEGWAHEVGSAASRLLNAALGGDGAVTFSAASWGARVAGTRFGALRVRLIDRLNRQPGHCEAAWRWHAAHGLLA